MSRSPILTVVVCTFNRASILKECLDSLVNQTASTEFFAVLVVDNNSTDRTKSLVSKYIDKYDHFSLVTEEEQGLSFARNRGVNETDSPWIAYLDDDARARKDWVANILRTIASADFDVFGGVYTAWHRFAPCPVWFSPLWETNRWVQDVYGEMDKFRYPSGGNCIYSRSAFDAAGLFPVCMGMSGAKTAYGEETVLIREMRRLGMRIGFNPRVIVDHSVLPHKYNILWRIKSSYARGYSLAIIEKDRVSYLSFCGSIFRCLKLIFLKLPIIASKLLSDTNYLWQRAVLDFCSPLYSEFGFIVGVLRQYIVHD